MLKNARLDGTPLGRPRMARIGKEAARVCHCRVSPSEMSAVEGTYLFVGRGSSGTGLLQIECPGVQILMDGD